MSQLKDMQKEAEGREGGREKGREGERKEGRRDK